MLRVSVLVPILNAARTLPACLSAIERLDPQPMEILFVDNGSTDGSLLLIETFRRDHPTHQVWVLVEPRRGAAAARNAGIRAAKGDVIAFTDADCAPDPAWLHHLAQPFEDSATGAVAGRVIAASAVTTLELFSALYTLQLPDRPTRHCRWTPWEGGFPTANLAVRRDLVEKLRGFDEEVTIYGEDYDLCARLYEQGAMIAYAPEAKTYHYHRTTLHSMLRQAFGFGRSHPYLLRRHVPGGLWIELPRHSFVFPRCPGPIWIDLASADKKALAVLILGTVYRPALILLVLLAFWLTVSTRRRAESAGTPVRVGATVRLAALLIMKSFAMTVGRWWGSVIHKALCL